MIPIFQQNYKPKSGQPNTLAPFFGGGDKIFILESSIILLLSQQGTFTLNLDYFHPGQSFCLFPILDLLFPEPQSFDFLLYCLWWSTYLSNFLKNSVWKVNVLCSWMTENVFTINYPHLIGSLARYRILRCKKFFLRIL